MEILKTYLFTTLNAFFLIIIFFKWVKFGVFKSPKNKFFTSFYYKKYEIVNSRNNDSKKNKIIQNRLSVLLLIVIFVQIILIILFRILSYDL
jgi:hypothetical protein